MLSRVDDAQNTMALAAAPLSAQTAKRVWSAPILTCETAQNTAAKVPHPSEGIGFGASGPAS